MRHESFLAEKKSRTLFCLNRKVASSRWQMLINRVHKDNPLIAGLIHDGLDYKWGPAIPNVDLYLLALFKKYEERRISQGVNILIFLLLLNRGMRHN